MALYKRPTSKYWWMKFYFEGELVQQSTKCTNKRDAVTYEGGYRTALAMGKVGIKPKPKAPTFKEAVADFLLWSKMNHAQKPRTFLRVKYTCKQLTLFFKETKVDRIEPQDIEKFIYYRSTEGTPRTGKIISRDSVNNELAILKTIFKRLVASGVLAQSPAREIKRLAANHRKFHVITPDEEKLYLMACPQPLQDVATIMLETGMRPTEVHNLQRENVSIEKGFLQIENSKTKSSNRRVWLPEKTVEILRKRLKRFSGKYLFPKDDKDFELPNENLHHEHHQTLNQLKLKFRIYDCRHTFATRAAENGVDLLTLAHLLGHSSLDEVMRYAHVNETRKSEAMKQMQKKGAKAV